MSLVLSSSHVSVFSAANRRHSASTSVAPAALAATAEWLCWTAATGRAAAALLRKKRWSARGEEQIGAHATPKLECVTQY